MSDFWKNLEKPNQESFAGVAVPGQSSDGVSDFWKNLEITQSTDNSTNPAFKRKTRNYPANADPALVKLLEQGRESASKRPTPVGMLMQAGKGVPIAGNFLPETDEMKWINEQYPNLSKGLNIAGGVAGSIGPVGAVARGTQGVGMAAQMLAQGGLGAGMNVADLGANSLAKTGDLKGVTGADALKSGGAGFAGGSLGPLIGKALSPGTLLPPITTRAQFDKFYNGLPSHAKQDIREEASNIARSTFGSGKTADEIAHEAANVWRTANKEASAEATEGTFKKLVRGIDKKAVNMRAEDSIMEALKRGALGAGTSFALTQMGMMHPFLATALTGGAAAAPYIPKHASKYLHNTKFQDPTTATILNLLTQGTGREADLATR